MLDRATCNPAHGVLAQGISSCWTERPAILPMVFWHKASRHVILLVLTSTIGSYILPCTAG